MKLLIFPGMLEGFRTRKDRTISIQLATQELTPEIYANLMNCLNKHCEILVKEGEINTDDIKEFESKQFDEFDKRQEKTPAQRQRNVLYILWEQDKQGFEEFRDYYDSKMEKFIEHLKTKIIDK